MQRLALFCSLHIFETNNHIYWVGERSRRKRKWWTKKFNSRFQTFVCAASGSPHSIPATFFVRRTDIVSIYLFTRYFIAKLNEMKPRSESEQGRGEKEPHNKNKNKCVVPTMTIDCVQLASFARLWIFSICLTEIILCCSTHRTICDFRVFLHSISMLFNVHTQQNRTWQQ